MTADNADCILDIHDKLGEGALWCPQERALYWVDVPMPAAIQRYVPATGTHERWDMPQIVASMAKRADGTLLVAAHHGLYVFSPATGSLKLVAAPEAAVPENRSNDGGTDPRGRFWFGSMQNNLAPDNSPVDIGAQGVLYKVEAGFRVTPMEGGIGISNATCWSPDGATMYFADTMRNTIFAYDFDADLGAVSNKRVFSDLEGHGHPDGATTDSEGYLWNARWEGGCVIRFAPDGRVDRILEVPAPRVTSCVFGDDDLETLYITTARIYHDDDELARYPQAGGLFSARVGVRGTVKPMFAG